MTKDILDPPKPHADGDSHLDRVAARALEYQRLYLQELQLRKKYQRKAKVAERKVFSLSKGHEAMKAERNALAKALKRIADWDDFTVSQKVDIGSKGQELHYRGIASGALAASTLHTKYFPNQKDQ